MKLFAFTPKKYGIVYFVIAEHEEEARAIVRRYIAGFQYSPDPRLNDLSRNNALREWDGDDYRNVEVANPGEVLTSELG